MDPASGSGRWRASDAEGLTRTPVSAPSRAGRAGFVAWTEVAGSAPLNASVRTAGSLVAAEVGHGLVQARAADAHEREGDDLFKDLAWGRTLLPLGSLVGAKQVAVRARAAPSTSPRSQREAARPVLDPLTGG